MVCNAGGDPREPTVTGIAKSYSTLEGLCQRSTESQFTNHNPNLPAISQVAQVYDSSTRSDVHTPVVSSYPLSVVGYTQTISVDWRNATTRKSGTTRTTAHRVGLLSSDVWLPRIHTGAGHLTFTVHITNRSQINPASVTRAACTYRLWT